MVFSGMISAWMRGDPHFTTMDGLTYTFNGRGEFVLLKTENVELQVRLASIHFFLVKQVPPLIVDNVRVICLK